MLALTGKAIEGDVLTAVEVIPKSEIQQCVWSKYKKDVHYQWYCLHVTMNSFNMNLNCEGNQFEALKSLEH